MRCELCGREDTAAAPACLGCGNVPTASAPAGRRWWLKKRWRVTALLLLAYPFSLWLAVYLVGRGVLATPSRIVAVAYAPIWPVIYDRHRVRPGSEWFHDGVAYFHALGQRHAASD